MSLLTRLPTLTQTPDAGQGGLAVTGITTTGHAETSTSSSANAPAPSGSDSDSDSKSARWFGLQATGQQQIDVRLKFSWLAAGGCLATGGEGGSDPQIDGAASASCSFQIQYSLNGGSNWITHVTDSAEAFSSSGASDADSFNNNNSANIVLSNTQDVSQIQVRCLYQSGADGTAGNGVQDATASAQVDVTISGIQVEVTTADARHLLIMM